MSASNNTKSLRFMSYQVEKNLRSLEALKQSINQNIFILIMTSKIPRDVLIRLEVQKGSKNKLTVNITSTYQLANGLNNRQLQKVGTILQNPKDTRRKH